MPMSKSNRLKLRRLKRVAAFKRGRMDVPLRVDDIRDQKVPCRSFDGDSDVLTDGSMVIARTREAYP